MASRARALLIALALAACAGDDDDLAVTTTTTSTTSTTVATSITAAEVRAEILDEWDGVPDPARSCFVVANRNGDLVIDHNADVPVVPASVLKLLVADVAPDDPRIPSILRDSDNDAARAVVDELGGPDALEQRLVERSRPMAGVDVRDATGHDRANRVTCRLLVSILTSAPDSIRDALAIAGQPGTLADRYPSLAGRLRAKTGSIRGVSSLAGYLDGLTFAVVLNADADPTPAVDAIVDGLAS